MKALIAGITAACLVATFLGCASPPPPTQTTTTRSETESHPPPDRLADLTAGDIVLVCGGNNQLPMHITIDTSANKVRYQVMEADGETPWSKVGVVSANITANTISWASDPSTDAPRQYTLDRESNHLTVTWSNNGEVDSEYDCH